MYHGIINVYKEAGYTSHDVVARLRGICKQKRIGHTGTLDPDAVGVLPVCLGNATRLCDMLTDRRKEYIATFRLGVVTDTQDISGRVLEEKEVTVSSSCVKEAIMSFVGSSMQVPPMYSALKVNGKKLYELAREGKEVERAARSITIYSIEILKDEHPQYSIKVECSKGTYIRTLCHDIGQMLECGGVMTSLVRTKVGEFDIEKAYTLDELQQISDKGNFDQVVLPVEKVFEGYPAFTVKESSFNAVKNGNQLKEEDFKEELVGFSNGTEATDGIKIRVYSHQNIFFGLYRYEERRKLFSPVKMFLPQ